MDFGIEYGYWQARAEEDFSDTVGEYTRLSCSQFPSYLAKLSYDRCDTATRQAMTLNDKDLWLHPVDEQQLKRWRSLVALIRGEYSMSF